MRKKYNKIIRLGILSTFFTAVAVGLSFLTASLYVLKDVSYDVPLQGNPTTKIKMATHYIDIDVTAGTLTADWYPFIFNCSDPEEVVNIYFDPNTLIQNDDTRIASNKPPDRPTFQFMTRCQKGIRDSQPTFRTVAKLIGKKKSGIFSGPSLQWYPKDIYFVQFSLFAQLNSSNASVGIITSASFGTPVNFNIALEENISANTEEGLFLLLIVKRSAAVKAIVVFIVLANWMATVAFLCITFASCIWPEWVVKELFVIPIAALFAFTAVRSIMPGAPPGFGAYVDFVGILPNIALIMTCSVCLLLVVLVRRTWPKDNPEDLEPRFQEQATVQPREEATVQPREEATVQPREEATVQPREEATVQP